MTTKIWYVPEEPVLPPDCPASPAPAHLDNIWLPGSLKAREIGYTDPQNEKNWLSESPKPKKISYNCGYLDPPKPKNPPRPLGLRAFRHPDFNFKSPISHKWVGIYPFPTLPVASAR